MNKPPAYQMYAKDWNSSPTISRMDYYDRGIFITALNASWDSEEPGTLPADLEVAARICRIQVRTFRNFLQRYPETFRQFGDKLVNQKLHSCWINYQEISEKRRKAVETRYSTNVEQEHLSASASAPALNTHIEEEPKKPRNRFQKPTRLQVFDEMTRQGFPDPDTEADTLM